MKVRQLFEAHETSAELIAKAKKSANISTHVEDRLKDKTHHIIDFRIFRNWKGGPMTVIFDYPDIKHIFLVGPAPVKLHQPLADATAIINKYLIEPNRQQAKSECTEELFNAGLKDYI